MMAGKSTQHLQSERGEPFVESVGKMIDMLQLQMAWVPMLDMQGLQGEMTEVVAHGNSNVELHREVLEVVESRDLPVNLSDTTISLLFSDPSFREIYENGFASLFKTDLNRSVEACVVTISA